MNISHLLEEYLRSIKKTTIALEDLERQLNEIETDPNEFGTTVVNLEKLGVLEAVKSAGRTMKQPSLAYRYRVNKSLLRTQYTNQLQQYRLTLHPAIKLDSYFALPEQQFE